MFHLTYLKVKKNLDFVVFIHFYSKNMSTEMLMSSSVKQLPHTKVKKKNQTKKQYNIIHF